jgi:hypothetical protein
VKLPFKIQVSDAVPPGKAFAIAPVAWSSEEGRRLRQEVERHIAAGMNEQEARLTALAEAGKLVAIHFGPDTLEESPF